MGPSRLAKIAQVVGAGNSPRLLLAICTAGTTMPMRTPMMVITTSSSTSVNPAWCRIERDMENSVVGTPLCP